MYGWNCEYHYISKSKMYLIDLANRYILCHLLIQISYLIYCWQYVINLRLKIGKAFCKNTHIYKNTVFKKIHGFTKIHVFTKTKCGSGAIFGS